MEEIEFLWPFSLSSGQQGSLCGRLKPKKPFQHSHLWAEVFFLLEHCDWKNPDDVLKCLCFYLLGDQGQTWSAGRTQFEQVSLQFLGSKLTLCSADVVLPRDGSQGFGTVEIIFENLDFGVYRLCIPPKGGIPSHLHKKIQEHELLLSPFSMAGAEINSGVAFSWPLGWVHGYHNLSSKWGMILCVDTPPFDAADEQVVDIEPAPWDRVVKKSYW